ncbi:type IIG restriction enzyme/methyltransferase [Geminocystis herdmanii]|uniref:type IIG restriction enzyme/methyltransferase n=1 Tax=Geminocystis herdmanii TaxID=669359 RepID=UPI000349208B|nr:Eco57I restriction-modification methylase domain-containing protein [Geminocystis herdmanii]
MLSNLRQSLNKGYLKLPSLRADVEQFQDNLHYLLNITNHQINESEEFHKNNLINFLNHSFYRPNHYINTKEKDDLVIYNGKDINSKVGIIVEVKKPTNKTEMLNFEQFNSKSLQQLLFYYLQERITHQNFELKHLIVTNIYEWFIFPSELFEKFFYQDKSLIKQFNDFNENRLTSKNTDFFYKEIAQVYLGKVETYLKENTVYLNLKEFQNVDLKSLNILYKFLSPYHLLKLPFSNDSNSLDEDFYSELLHIIGLTEIKEGSKKLIRRLPINQRFEGSLLENTINQLQTYNKLDNLDNINIFGETQEKQLFNIALELVITWINRILFLKLLEAQLITYNRHSLNNQVNDTSEYAFLNNKTIKDFHDLDTLFFQVLAKQIFDRTPNIQEKFYHIPYLNSSLFELTSLEQKIGAIALLHHNKNISYFGNTILKNSQGKKETGDINTLEYLLNFLTAYDFGSEGEGEIKEDNKRLINASVLGLIFEKINGYQDGSFFTPGFITMYMCRETIRRAIIHKFNQIKQWNCLTINDLYNKIQDTKEANHIINNIKICDPAVGSGHFLVSALNEIISIKSELEILEDKQGKRLKNYHIIVENDELIITDENNQLFTYNPLNQESQRIQETLFSEKQTIIENCLFGVDINTNSVKICRLRLWIELLKNSYYTSPPQPFSPKSKGGEKNNKLSHQFPSPDGRGVRGEGKTLQTLPNIDINIKCGNSLISRFDINDSFSSAKIKRQIEEYKEAVKNYYRPENRQEKQKIIQLIELIKNNLSNEITGNDESSKKLRQLQGELNNLVNQQSLFEETVKEKKVKEKKIKQLEKQINQYQLEIEDKKHNRIYHNAFEWRFEFPEVLDNEGNFIGFDVIIGNPPYIRQEEFSPLKPLLKQRYKIYNSIADLLTYFVELGYNLLHYDGIFQFIISNKFTRANYGQEMRSFLLENTTLTHFIDFSGLAVFDEATVDSAILGYVKNKVASAGLIYADVKKETVRINDFSNYLTEIQTNFLQSDLTVNSWSFENPEVLKIKAKIESQGIPLKDWNITINYGIKTGYNDAFIIDGKTRQDLINQDGKSAEIIKPLLRGRDIHKYYANFQDLWLINLHNGYEVNHQKIPALNVNDYPAIKQHLDQFYPKLIKRSDQGKTPYNLRNCAYIPDFEKPKILYPEFSSKSSFTWDENNHYYTLDTCWILNGGNYYLLSLLNSSLMWFYLKTIVSVLGTQAFRMKKIYLEELPVKQITEKEEKFFKKLVTDILKLKTENPNNDTSKLERKVDLLVYELYGLTEEEIRIIEE